MKKMNRLIEPAKILFLIAFALIFLMGCGISNSNSPAPALASANETSAPDQNSNLDLGSSSFDVNVSIRYKIILDKKVEKADPNIIRAARQAMFDYDANNARLSHYNGYSVYYDILVLDVIDKGKNAWEVRYRDFQHSDNNFQDGYTDLGSYTYPYSVVAVSKKDTGEFVGTLHNPGGPLIRIGETY